MIHKLTSFLQRFNAPVYVVLITLCMYLGFAGLHLKRHGFDPSFFVVAGDQYADSSRAPANLSILKNSHGYDGQFYYRLAMNPLSNKQTDHGIRIDDPHYRGQRILYPVMAYVLSAGNVSALPWVLILINLSGLGVMAWLGAKYMQRLGWHALWALAFTLQAGFLTTFTRDLTEIIEIVFLLAFLISIHQKQYFRSALFISLAILSKETSLLIAVATAATLGWEVFNKRNFRKDMLWMLLPFGIYLGWQLWLNQHWGAGLKDVLHNALGYPMVNFCSYFIKSMAMHDIYQQKYFMEFCYLILFTSTTAFCFLRSSATAAVKLSWLLYACLVFSLSGAVWIEDIAFLRAIVEFQIMGTLILLDSQLKSPRLLLIAGCLAWLPLALFLITYS